MTTKEIAERYDREVLANYKKNLSLLDSKARDYVLRQIDRLEKKLQKKNLTIPQKGLVLNMTEFHVSYIDEDHNDWEATFAAERGVVGHDGLRDKDVEGWVKGGLTSLQRNGENMLHKQGYFEQFIEELKELAEINV